MNSLPILDTSFFFSFFFSQAPNSDCSCRFRSILEPSPTFFLFLPCFLLFLWKASLWPVVWELEEEKWWEMEAGQRKN